jgi:flagellar FliJ protein
MKRSKRLEPVGELLDEAEQARAAGVVAAQRRLAEAERRRDELQNYLGEYQNMFHQRAAAGMAVMGMRDYQVFIARLHDAVRQQEGVITQLKVECERERSRWLEAAVRKIAVSKVIAKARSEDQRLEERRSQKELDERAMRMTGAR